MANPQDILIYKPHYQVTVILEPKIAEAGSTVEYPPVNITVTNKGAGHGTPFTTTHTIEPPAKNELQVYRKEVILDGTYVTIEVSANGYISQRKEYTVLSSSTGNTSSGQVLPPDSGEEFNLTRELKPINPNPSETKKIYTFNFYSDKIIDLTSEELNEAISGRSLSVKFLSSLMPSNTISFNPSLTIEGNKIKASVERENLPIYDTIEVSLEGNANPKYILDISQNKFTTNSLTEPFWAKKDGPIFFNKEYYYHDELNFFSLKLANKNKIYRIYFGANLSSLIRTISDYEFNSKLEEFTTAANENIKSHLKYTDTFDIKKPINNDKGVFHPYNSFYFLNKNNIYLTYDLNEKERNAAWYLIELNQPSGSVFGGNVEVINTQVNNPNAWQLYAETPTIEYYEQVIYDAIKIVPMKWDEKTFSSNKEIATNKEIDDASGKIFINMAKPYLVDDPRLIDGILPPNKGSVVDQLYVFIKEVLEREQGLNNGLLIGAPDIDNLEFWYPNRCITKGIAIKPREKLTTSLILKIWKDGEERSTIEFWNTQTENLKFNIKATDRLTGQSRILATDYTGGGTIVFTDTDVERTTYEIISSETNGYLLEWPWYYSNAISDYQALVLNGNEVANFTDDTVNGQPAPDGYALDTSIWPPIKLKQGIQNEIILTDYSPASHKLILKIEEDSNQFGGGGGFGLDIYNSKYQKIEPKQNINSLNGYLVLNNGTQSEYKVSDNVIYTRTDSFYTYGINSVVSQYSKEAPSQVLRVNGISVPTLSSSYIPLKVNTVNIITID